MDSLFYLLLVGFSIILMLHSFLLWSLYKKNHDLQNWLAKEQRYPKKGPAATKVVAKDQVNVTQNSTKMLNEKVSQGNMNKLGKRRTVK